MITDQRAEAAIWKPVVGWDGIYEVSSLGSVRRVLGGCGAKVGKELKPSKMKNGYMMVSLSSNGRKRAYKTVHRIVAEAFIGGCDGLDVCHNNGIRSDNRIENLRVDTRSGNMKDTIKHGTSNRGERCGSNKHSANVIKSFRETAHNYKSVSEAARAHGIHPNYGYAILKRMVWSWL